MNHSVALQGLRSFSGGEDLQKTPSGNARSGFGMGKPDLLMQKP